MGDAAPVSSPDSFTTRTGEVVAVCRDGSHGFGKPVVDAIQLIEGLGVEGDAHAGKTVQHLSRIAKDPTQPNLRQVHLIHSELHMELQFKGFEVTSGQMGENITTRGLNLLALPASTLLRIGNEAIVKLTGLRNPCKQLDDFQAGLMAAVLDRDAGGELIRKAGVMGVVARAGVVKAGDKIAVELPDKPHRTLSVV